MYEENDNTQQVVYDEIPQTPLQPDPIEKPEVAEAAAPVQPETVSETPQQQQKRYTEEQQARNFAELRRLQDQKDRELDLMRREIEQLRQSQYRPQQQKDDLGLAKDSFAEVQHVEKIVQNALKEQEDRYRKQLEQERLQQAERALTIQYKDLYQVLSAENLRRLEQEEPEIAASIASNPDVYSAKIAAYKQIKKLGIAEDNYNAQRVQQRLAENAQRPRNPNATAPRQGSPALGAAQPVSGFAETITDDMAARYRKEMEEAISRM